MAEVERPIRVVERMLTRCNGGTIGAQGRSTFMLAEAKLIAVGKNGGTHQTLNQEPRHLTHFLLAETASRKSEIAEHVRRTAGIMPTHQPQIIDDPVLREIFDALGFGPNPNGGLIPGANLPLSKAIERVIVCMADSRRLRELMKIARFELEVLETPPLYVPQANFWMEHNGRRFSWHYAGAARYGAHDGTEMPVQGPLIRSVRLGVEFFIGAAEIWAGAQLIERDELAA